MPLMSAVHAVTTIGIDMGKNTLHMIGHRVAGEGPTRATVAPLGDAPEDGSVSGRHLLRDEADPSPKNRALWRMPRRCRSPQLLRTSR